MWIRPQDRTTADLLQHTKIETASLSSSLKNVNELRSKFDFDAVYVQQIQLSFTLPKNPGHIRSIEGVRERFTMTVIATAQAAPMPTDDSRVVGKKPSPAKATWSEKNMLFNDQNSRT